MELQTNAVKSLLVLTDFSHSAKNAANFALNLAEKLNANIILFNSYLIPDVGFDSWPSKDVASRSKESLDNLESETLRIQETSAIRKNTFKPQIESVSFEGSISENVTEIITEKQNIIMVIMGGGKCNGKDDMDFGIQITDVLVNVKCATLVIPNLEYMEF